MKITTKNKTRAGQDPVYMPAKEGPFRCSNCEYFISPNQCRKEEMITAQGNNPAMIDAGGCCNYFEKK